MYGNLRFKILIILFNFELEKIKRDIEFRRWVITEVRFVEEERKFIRVYCGIVKIFK